MKALYVTSLHAFSGKTALCLGLGRHFQKEGYKVGYFKPLSTQPWQTGGRMADEDADFVRRVLGLSEDPCDLVGIVLTPELLTQELVGESPPDLLTQIRQGFERASADKDIMLLEGSASLREGFCVGLGTPMVAEALNVSALAITPFHDRVSLVDDCIVAEARLGERLIGVEVNKVPEGEMDFVVNVARPYLERHGIPLLGVFPRRQELQAISVGELAEVLKGEFLTFSEKRDLLIEHLIVGAMSVEQALPRIRRVAGTKAVITGGDRADIQLVALETAVQCLVLTGHLRPVPEVLRRAEEVGVPVLLVRQNTLETVEAIERIFGKTRLGQQAKLEQFEAMLAERFDFQRLYKGMGLM